MKAVISFTLFLIFCDFMTKSSSDRHPQKLEVAYVIYHSIATGGLCHGYRKHAEQNFVKFGHLVSEICSQTDEHTHADCNMSQGN